MKPDREKARAAEQRYENSGKRKNTAVTLRLKPETLQRFQQYRAKCKSADDAIDELLYQAGF